MQVPRTRRRSAVAVAAAVLTPGAAIAQSTTSFGTRSSFEFEVSQRALLVETESFEDLSVISGVRTVTTSTGLTITDDPAVSASPGLNISDTPSDGAFATDGSVYILYDDAGGTGNNITITFPYPTNAFGVDLTDAADDTDEEGVVITLDTGVQLGVVDGGQADGNQSFFGVISDLPFTSVTFDLTDDEFFGENIGFDNVVFSRFGVAQNLGRVANPNHPLDIDTDRSTIDTIAAIYTESGTIVFENDTDISSNAAFNGVSLPGPGRYYLAVAACCTDFSEDFGASNITHGTGIVTGEIAGVALDVFQQDSAEIHYFAFEAAEDVDTLTRTGPIPTIDLGVVAGSQQDFEVSFFFAGPSESISYAIYNRETGRVVSTGTDVGVGELPEGDYILAITGSNPGGFADGYRIRRPSDFQSFALTGTITPLAPVTKEVTTPTSFDISQISENEVRFVAFSIADPVIPGDLDRNGDGLIDFLDAIAFLEDLDAATGGP